MLSDKNTLCGKKSIEQTRDDTQPLGFETVTVLQAITGEGATKLPRSAEILLQAAHLAGLAGLIIDTAEPDLRILGRNERAASLFSLEETSLVTAERVARMSFYALHSHALLVAAGADLYRGELVLLGDALPTRRRLALMRITSVAEDTRVLLLIGDPVNWQAVDLWSLETDGAIDTIHRLRDVSQR